MKKRIEFYTDQELDKSSNLYNYDARLYDPVIGRFISADSIVPDWYDPQSLNKYSYCLNNPLVYVDPNGHDPESALELISSHRHTIKSVSSRLGVSPQAIGSIMFQEKYHGIFAILKNVPSNIDVSLGITDSVNKRSIGLAEMQLRTAARLLGKDLSNKAQREQVIQALRDDKKAIELIGLNVADMQNQIGRELTPEEAAAGHNMGVNGLNEHLKGNRSLSDIAKRSADYQMAITIAINTGRVDDRKDKAIRDEIDDELRKIIDNPIIPPHP